LSCPRIAIKSARANQGSCSLGNVAKELSSNLQEDHAPNNLGTIVEVCRPLKVTTIEETACDELQWHIARLPKTSSKACFVQQAVFKKKNIAKIFQDNKSIAAPTYTWKNKAEYIQFYFCNNDIECYVKGMRRKLINVIPNVPNI
jgi:hypothetical protein